MKAHSVSALATLLRLDRRTITRVVEGLEPAGTRRGHPTFALSDVLRVLLAGRESDRGDVTLAEARRRRAAAEARIAEIELARMEGEMVPIDDTVRVVGEAASLMRSKILQIPIRVALDDAVLRERLTAACHEALQELVVLANAHAKGDVGISEAAK